MLAKQSTILALTAAAVLGLGSSAARAGQAALAPSTPATSPVEDVVVVGRRSGIPIWRVRSGTTTLVLVGTISGVTKDAKWDPTSLVAALRMADRVMFPHMQQVRASPFAMLGYLAKWRSQASLPKGQSLANLLTAEQYQRLVDLQRKGIAKRGSERKHPLHLAISLRATARPKGGYGDDPDQYVMRTIQREKLRLVPIQTLSAKPLATELFEGPASRHVPCLLDAMTLAEAGPPAVAARSQAWAQRRVADVLASPAEDVFHSCFPADPAAAPARRAALYATIASVLREPELTVAVLDLHLLAGSGGVLDGLAAAGHDVTGPAWK